MVSKFVCGLLLSACIIIGAGPGAKKMAQTEYVVTTDIAAQIESELRALETVPSEGLSVYDEGGGTVRIIYSRELNPTEIQEVEEAIAAHVSDEPIVHFLEIRNATINEPVKLITTSEAADDVNMEINSKGYGGVYVDAGGSVVFRTPATGETKYTQFRITNATVAPVNNLVIGGSVTTDPPTIAAEGSDTNIDIEITPKGTGRLTVNGEAIPSVDSTDTLANKTLDAPIFAAGDASAGTKPKLTAGSLMTTPEEGAMELSQGRFFLSPEAGGRGVVSVEYVMCLSGTNTLTNSGSEQPLFDSGISGVLTLQAGTYIFEALVGLSSMSGTSGNIAFDILGSGSATLGTILYHVTGIDGAINTAAAQTGLTSNAAQSPASIVVAGTSTQAQFLIRGTFRVTAAGTIVPSGTLVTGAAAVVAAGSYFRCHAIGRANMTYQGPWS